MLGLMSGISSCSVYHGTDYPKYNTTQKIERKSRLVHQIPSHIELISKGDKGVFNQKLSDSLDNFIHFILNEKFSDSLKGQFFKPTLAVQHKTIEYKLMELVETIEKKNSLENVMLDSSWCAYYSSYNQRYVLISQNFGFTRTKKNLRRHSFGSSSITTLSGKYKYTYIPNSFFRNDIILLLDLKRQIVVFYQHFKGVIDPLDPKWGTRIMNELLENAQNPKND